MKLIELREEMIEGIKVNGMLVQKSCFSDDIAMVTESEENLGNTLTKINVS